MEKRGALALVLTALVVGGGFATSASAAEVEVQVGHYATIEESVPLAPSVAYLVTMRGMLVGQAVNDQSDADLIASGRALCSNEIASGMTWSDLPALTEQWGMSLAFTRAYVATAAAAFCPAALPGMI